MIRVASFCSFALLALLWTGCPAPQLMGGACSASNCPGCCDAHGACQTGTSTSVCGHGGAACQACSGGAACTAQGTCGSVATCSPQSCNGCCAPNGSCISPSNTIFACGSSGGACQVCSGQQACSNGNCVNTGTCSGCLDLNGNCQPGTSTSNCGANGAECSLCSAGQSCTSGQCTSPCNASTCPNGCCNGGTCVPYASQNNFECGSGGVACGACTNGHTCNGSGQCSGGGSCSAATCPNGCCNGTTCVPYTSENNTECGSGGAACAACGTGLSCNGSGQCTGGTGCTASSCPNGCCSGSTCVPYASENNGECGHGGATCAACVTGQTCSSSGVCSGGGTVTGTGGSVPSLFFAVVGDTRPGTNEDCASYPTSVITKIYQNLEAMNPRPQFILTTGDYQYCSPGATCTTAPVGQPCAQTQIGFYAQAQTTWTGGPVFSSMGNHECNGFTASNMTFSGSDYSQGSCDGTPSDNYSQWFSKLVAPLGQTKPYYVVPINATDGSWTSKFINVACNAWDSTQQSWLQSALAQSTTYTFVFRHEDPGAQGPCVSTVDSMLSSANYTMLIFGHSHSFQATPPKNLLVGNGGAGSGPFGYATVQQQGTHFLVTQYDYSSGSAVGTTTY